MTTIYVIASEDGPQKVGISGNLRRRLSTLQTASAVQLRIMFSAEVLGDAEAVEDRAHAIMAANRLKGEWFRVTSDQAVAAIKRAVAELGFEMEQNQAADHKAAMRGRVSFQVVDATTEEDIRRHLAEDGFDPDNPLEGLVEALNPAEIRRRAGLTQPEMAERLRIPVATWRNWEQGRTSFDPAIRSFLNALSHDPEYTFRLIAGRDLPNWCNGQMNGDSTSNDIEFLISLVSTPASLDELPIPYEAARPRRIQGETRFDAVFDAMRKRHVA